MSDAPVPESTMRRVAMTALAGTSIEWYDFFLYGTAAALVFPVVFFPEDMPPVVGLIASFSTFAVGFLARPVGGVVFGHFGDRIGRKATLVTALMLMGGATTLIGLLPGYASIGAAAPLSLVLLRFVQGLAVGGQWGGAMLLVTESAPPDKRGFYGAFAQAGAPVGVVLANLAFLLVVGLSSDEFFMEWGWRIPFVSSIVLIGLSMYVQLRLEDTPAFQQLQAAAQQTGEDRPPRSPVLEAVRLYPRQITLAAGAFLAVQVSFYILIAFVVAYGSGAAGIGLPESTMLSAVLVASLAQVPTLFLAGSWSDRHGRRGIYTTGAVLMAIWAFAIFPLIDTGNFLLVCVALAGGQMLVGLMYGPQAAMLAELFETRVRYSGASLGYQGGAILGGALAPLIATSLYASSGHTLWISVYMAVACLLTVVSVRLLHETRGTELIDT